MKTLKSVLLICLVVFTLTACGTTGKNSTTTNRSGGTLHGAAQTLTGIIYILEQEQMPKLPASLSLPHVFSSAAALSG